MAEIEKFAWDTILEQTVQDLVNLYQIKAIVETGTWIGGTTRAFASMVDQVYTVETQTEFYLKARKILDPLPNVHQFFGKSQDFIRLMTETAEKPTLYYLDAHWHGSHPLPLELETIADIDPSPVIVMHDFKVPGHPELKFDTRNGGQPYCFEWIEPQLRKLKRPWQYFYNKEATGGCKVGVLFVVPDKR